MLFPIENTAVQNRVTQLWEFMRSLGAVKTLSPTVSVTGRCASEEDGLQQLMTVYLIF